MKRFFWLILVFAIGGAGGVTADRVVLPYVAGTRLGDRYPSLRRMSERTTIVKTTEIVRVEEGEAVPDLAERAKSALLPVEFTRKPKAAARGAKGAAPASASSVAALTTLATGMAYTSDGYVLLRDSDPASIATGSVFVLIDEGTKVSAEVVAIDTTTAFVLLRVRDRSLPVLPFADETPRLGSRLFTLSAMRLGGVATRRFGEAHLAAIADGLLGVSGAEDADAVLVNFQGQLVGFYTATAPDAPNAVITGEVLRKIGEELISRAR